MVAWAGVYDGFAKLPYHSIHEIVLGSQLYGGMAMNA